jgi:hypothetical protein
MTPQSAKCIAANLNALASAAVAVGNYNLRSNLIEALVTLRANLYADYYDVLPTVDGRKAWPPIKRGDTWDLNGKSVPYTDDEIDPDNDINF